MKDKDDIGVLLETTVSDFVVVQAAGVDVQNDARILVESVHQSHRLRLRRHLLRQPTAKLSEQFLIITWPTSGLKYAWRGGGGEGGGVPMPSAEISPFTLGRRW